MGVMKGEGNTIKYRLLPHLQIHPNPWRKAYRVAAAFKMVILKSLILMCVAFFLAPIKCVSYDHGLLPANCS